MTEAKYPETHYSYKIYEFAIGKFISWEYEPTKAVQITGKPLAKIIEDNFNGRN